MNSTSTTQHLLANRFLPVCQYISIFGLIFYKNGLITLERKSETIPVLNTFFEYLANSKNESETKLQFLQNVLNQSGDYGNGKYQPLDVNYVKETYHHIISTTLFSSYGNIDGYLIKIFNVVQSNTYPDLKKVVLKHLLQNYTNEDYCSSQRNNTKLTFLAFRTIFKDYIWPIFEKNNSLLTEEYNKHRISKRDLTSNNSLEGLGESYYLTESNMEFFSELGKGLYYEGFEAIQLFQQNGLSFIRNDPYYLQCLRDVTAYISRKQFVDKQTLNNTIELWFSHTINRPFFVHYLKNLKEDFYFNDITILTDIHPGKIHPKKPKFSLKTEVRYHMKFNSLNGLIDLAKFHHSFKNQYIVFPEVEFSVLDTRYYNGKDILILDLEERLSTKNKTYSLYQTNALLHRKRLEIIKKCALDVSFKTPLHRIKDTEELLKQYILRIDKNSGNVPTYDMLADDIYSSITIPEKYDEWKITRNIYVDDVLYKYYIRSFCLTFGFEQINELYDGAYRRDEVSKVCINYNLKSLTTINMRFEDYFVLYAHSYPGFKKSKHVEHRALAAIYRLALMQCDEEWIETPITLYSAVNVSDESFMRMVEAQRGAIMNIFVRSVAFSTKEAALEHCLTTNSLERLVLYQLEFRNQAGIAEISRIFENPRYSFFITDTIIYLKDHMKKTIIDGREVYIVILKSVETPKENIMVKLINLLNNLLSKDILFYVD